MSNLEPIYLLPQNVKRLLLITRNRCLRSMIGVLSYVWEDARIWVHRNYALEMHLNYLMPISKAQNASCFSPS